MKHFIYFFLFICSLSFSAYAADQFVEGKDYQLIESTQAAENNKSEKVEVIEFFSYGCPWCYRLEPMLQTWLKTKGKDIEFQRVPVVFESGWEVYAKAFYAANALGIADKLSPKIFDAIHKENKKLIDEKEMEAFFIANGVSSQDFNSAFRLSPDVDLHINQGLKLMHDYQIYQVPSIVVAKRYKTNPQLAKGDDKRMLAIVDYLIQLNTEKNK